MKKFAMTKTGQQQKKPHTMATNRCLRLYKISFSWCQPQLSQCWRQESMMMFMLLMKKHELKWYHGRKANKSISQASKIHDFSEKKIHKFLYDVFGFFLHIYSSFGIYSINYSWFMLYLFANERNTKKKNIEKWRWIIRYSRR